MTDFLTIPNAYDEVRKGNPYLNSEFGVNWDSMGLNNLKNVYDTKNNANNNFMDSTLGTNWFGSLSSIIGAGVTAWGVHKGYKSYKSLKWENYKNELPLLQIDTERENTLTTLYENNSNILREATDMVNYNSYVQAMENKTNQGMNEQAYQNSIFKIDRQVKQKTAALYTDIQTLNLNSEAAKNAELVRQKMEFLYTKQAALNAFHQNLNTGISQFTDFMGQIERLPAFNRKDQIKADTTIADAPVNVSSFQYYTTQQTLQTLKLNGFENSQQYLAQNNKVAIGQFDAYLNKKYDSQGLNRSDFRVPNLSEVYFDFD